MVKDYTRKITHKDYRNPNKLKKYYHRVEKKFHPSFKTYKISKRAARDYEWADDNFIAFKYPNWVTPVLGGGTSLGFFLIFIWPSEESLNSAEKFFTILTLLLTLFFVFYWITQPTKEHVLNRRDGLLTMTGFFWQKNITMEFDKVEFAYSTGGEDGVGGFILQAIRPNKWQTFDTYEFYGDCYNTMTFIMWYMDKNRPLPPGDFFDPYRQKDYERRKAEGFPKPLYSGNIPTPEATTEQQKEREKIGGW